MTEGSPSLSPIQIPLLIQEKLNFYIWYHRLRSVHKEYFETVKIYQNIDGNIAYIQNTNTIIRLLECNIEFEYRYDRIYKFTTSNRTPSRIRVPSKFYFSSGLNHKNGYKLSYEQELDREIDKM
jgi:hypothetical protein